MEKLIQLAVFLLLGLVSSLAHADESTDGLARLHCPFTAEFNAVVINPSADGQQLIRCLNSTGSAYYSELGDIAVNSDDTSWLHSPYPSSDLCMGMAPEDCKFYNE